MELKDILNLVALVLIPIAAVVIGQRLQIHSEKRKDKMQIFKKFSEKIFRRYKRIDNRRNFDSFIPER